MGLTHITLNKESNSGIAEAAVCKALLILAWETFCRQLNYLTTCK